LSYAIGWFTEEFVVQLTRDFLFSTTSRNDPGSTQRPIQWISPGLCLEVSWPGRWLFTFISCWD